MLMKEAVIEVAREIKKEQQIQYQEDSILKGYPDDLSDSDIRKALIAISAVSDVILKVS